MDRDGRALRVSILIAILVLCDAVSPSGLGAGGPDDNVVETFDIARDGDLLLVPITLGDRQYQFVVDTGTTFSIIDTALESYLEPLPGFAQVNGKREKRYHLRSAFVGTSRQSLAGKAICVDLSEIRDASGYDVRGLLGMDFLKARVVRVDFDARKHSLLKRAPASAGSELRLFYNKFDVPMVNVEIADGEPAAFAIDTGMLGRALSLRSYQVDELVKNGRLELSGPPVLTAALGGSVRLRYGQLAHFRLGDFQHERVTISEGERNQIGIDLLSRYIVTFDFPNERLYLRERDKGHPTR